MSKYVIRTLFIAGLVLLLLVGFSPGVGSVIAEETLSTNSEQTHPPHEQGYEEAPVMVEGHHGSFSIDNGQNHYFAVDLEEGDELTASILFDHDEGDLDLAVDNPDEETLEQAVSVTDNETVTIEADQEGLHYVRPYGYDGASNTYDLHLEIDERSPPRHERGYDEAPVIEEGDHGSFTIDDGEHHYFAVELEEGDELTASIFFDHDEGDLDLAVDNPDEETLEQAISVTDNETVTIEADQEGLHYVRPYGYDGASNTYDLEVIIDEEIGEIAPRITVDPQRPTEGDEIELDATESAIENGHIISYTWDIEGDGITDSDQERLRASLEAGRHEITLTVEANDGSVATVTEIIEVEPEDVVGEDGRQAQSDQSTATQSTDISTNMRADQTRIEVGSEILVQQDIENLRREDDLHVRWTLDDLPSGFALLGDVPQQATLNPGERETVTLRVVPNDPGQYNLTGLVSYSFDGEQTSEEQKRESLRIIAEQPSSVNVELTTSRSTVSVSEEVVFDASDSTGDVQAYQWRFGDGETASGAVAAHSYSEPGEYEVVAIVESDYELETKTTTITVTERSSENSDGSDVFQDIGLPTALLGLGIGVFMLRVVFF